MKKLRYFNKTEHTSTWETIDIRQKLFVLCNILALTKLKYFMSQMYFMYFMNLFRKIWNINVQNFDQKLILDGCDIRIPYFPIFYSLIRDGLK